MYDSQILEAYSEHLQSYPWDTYFTVTTRKPWRVSNHLSSAIWRTLELFGASRSFTAIESNFMVDSIHAHGLARFPDWKELNTQSLWKYLFKQFGRTTVETARSAEQVSSYCSKYILKNNSLGECFYLGDKNAWIMDDNT